MKTLILIRHAKSNAEQFNQSDFERSLSERGERDALASAEKLLLKISSIDLLLSSAALRTKQTAAYFISALNISAEKTIYTDSLYLATAEKIGSVIASVENKVDNLIIVCHNPGITDYVNRLSNKVRLDNMPTSGIFCVNAEVEKWEDFEKAEKSFLFFDYPKKS